MKSSIQSSIQSRVAALKAKHDTNIHSDDSTPTPLSTFLTIYSKAGNTCYENYMQGAIALIDWLQPIDMPTISPAFKNYPRMLRTYQITTLAEQLADVKPAQRTAHNIDDNLVQVRYIEKAILQELFKGVIII